MDQIEPNLDKISITLKIQSLLWTDKFHQEETDVTQQSLKPQLLRMLVQENYFQGHLQFSGIKKDGTEVDSAIRDGSAHILRCLKVWYDLPSDVLFVAVNIMDRFLTKMKARRKHMACISVSAFHLACEQVAEYGAEAFKIPETKDLVTISQCQCTLRDLARMESIIVSKLESKSGVFPVTPLSFLRVFHMFLLIAADNLGIGAVYEKLVSPDKLWQCLEILVCDSACVNFRASEVALALLYAQLDEGCKNYYFSLDSSFDAHILRLAMLIVDLKSFCEISDISFCYCTEAANSVLQKYYAETVIPYRQRLIWRLSQRTLRYLRPTNKFTSALPTIYECSLLQFPLSSRCSSCSSDDCFPEDQ